MKRPILITVFAVLAFAVILIARLPASWLIPDPRLDASCAEVDGTIWNGACAGMIAHGQAIGDVTWELRAMRLLSGKLNAAVTLTQPSGTARAIVEVGLDKNVTARDVHADLPLDPALMPQLPADLHGQLHADIDLLQLVGHSIRTLEGHIEVHNLVQGAGSRAQQLGSFSLVFPPNSGDPVGNLRDLGGPLIVQGALHLTPQPGFNLQGVVKTRPDAPAELVRDIQYLGSPDAEGRRPFALEAAF
jgi:general secretion pathway protein N